MANVPISTAQLAAAALSLIEKASVPADDASLALVTTTRSFLRQIASGALIVSAAATTGQLAPQKPQVAPAAAPKTTTPPHLPRGVIPARPGPKMPAAAAAKIADKRGGVVIPAGGAPEA